MQTGGCYVLCPLSWSSLLRISVSLLVISVPSREDGCCQLSGRNTAAPHGGSCPAAALLCPCAPGPCQAGVGAQDPPWTLFFSICFSSSPIVDLEGCAVPRTAPGENTRSREDARRAGGDSSQRGAGSVPHQAAARTGRQSPSRAGAQTRPHFTAKQSLFVQPVLPEQSPVLTMSFLWLSPCRASSSALSPMPGSLQQRPPAAPQPHGRGAAPSTPAGPASLRTRLCSLQVKAKASQEKPRHS